MVEHEKPNTPDFTEAYKMAFETMKQLTTLNAGSIVVIGTFLKDIFPSENGTLAVGLGIKLLIALAFLSFGLSLTVSSYAMIGYYHIVREEAVARSSGGNHASRNDDSAWWRRWTIVRPVPHPSFIVGLGLFSFAVVLNL